MFMKHITNWFDMSCCFGFGENNYAWQKGTMVTAGSQLSPINSQALATKCP